MLAFALAAVAWLAVWGWHGSWAVAVVGMLTLLLVQPLVLAVEFVALPWWNRREPLPPAGAGRLLRAWWWESVSAQRVFAWRQPWREWACPDHLPSSATGRRAVVWVHGFACNRALWNPYLKRLRKRGTPFVAVNLEPVFGSIDAYAPLIDAAVRRAQAHTGQAPVLVGHSMGGLAIRAWWRAQGAAADERVHRVITIGTPHQGTVMGWFSSATNARQMRRDSHWLRELAASESEQRWARFTCYYSHCDNISLPATTSVLLGARGIHLPGWPHLAMAFAPPIWQEVLRALREAPQPRGCDNDAPRDNGGLDQPLNAG